SLLKNAPCPGPAAGEWAGAVAVPLVGASWVCASALGTSVAPATAPAPTAAPTRNARRALSCLVICDSSCGAFLRPGGPAEHRTSRKLLSRSRDQRPLRLRSVSWPRASPLAPDEHSSWSTRWAWPPEEIE